MKKKREKNFDPLNPLANKVSISSNINKEFDLLKNSIDEHFNETIKKIIKVLEEK